MPPLALDVASRRPGRFASGGAQGNDDGEFIPNGRHYSPWYMTQSCRSPRGAGLLPALYPPSAIL